MYLDTGGGAANDVSRNFNTSALGGLVNGQWYHIAFTFEASNDPNEGRVYLNGALVGAASWNGIDLDGSTDNPATLGMARFQGQRWGDLNGAIDDFRIYNTALTQEQIRQLIVPEPATGLLAAGGLFALAFRRRRA